MKWNKRAILLCLLILATVLMAAGCRKNAYEENDKKGYNVSVRYDANGGSFTGANTPFLSDCFNITDMPVDGDGMVSLALRDPSSGDRENIKPNRTGYFLLGWYTQRNETVDEAGNVSYTYSGLWDFDTATVKVDPNREYTSTQPVLTLYAAWAPLFTVEFYDLQTGEEMPLTNKTDSQVQAGATLLTPGWDEESGKMAMQLFPAKKGYTFSGAYYDAAGTQPITGESFSHTGIVNYENGTVQNPTMKIYVDFKEGNWFRITEAEQFKDNFSLSGCYDIQADLDFAKVLWPTVAMHGEFTGTILGNGHTLRNISFTQTDTKKLTTGLFGKIGESAKITDLNLENITLTIQKGSTGIGASYGLLTGNMAGVPENVTIVSGQILINTDVHFQKNGFSIGLICGSGTSEIDFSGITCSALETEGAEPLEIIVDNGTVYLPKYSEPETPEEIQPEDPAQNPDPELPESTEENM